MVHRQRDQPATGAALDAARVGSVRSARTAGATAPRDAQLRGFGPPTSLPSAPRMEDEMPAPARWFLLIDAEQVGPFAIAEVRARILSGAVTPTTWAWADGMPEWRQAARVPALIPPPGTAAPGWAATIEL